MVSSSCNFKIAKSLLDSTGIQYVNFHKTNFQNPAFFKIEVATDWAEQSVPGGIFQVQPRLG